MNAAVDRQFWEGYQPGFRFTTEETGTSEFFDAVAEHRYRLEPHIPEMVDFEQWSGRDVLEVGCGIATDGARFADCGASYTGLDRSKAARRIAADRFALFGLPGRFVEGDATQLPFDDASFDFADGPGNPPSKVYSRAQAEWLFNQFASVTTAVRFLNLRLYPLGQRLAGTRVAQMTGRRVGWHLCVRALKGT